MIKLLFVLFVPSLVLLAAILLNFILIGSVTGDHHSCTPEHRLVLPQILDATRSGMLDLEAVANQMGVGLFIAEKGVYDKLVTD